LQTREKKTAVCCLLFLSNFGMIIIYCGAVITQLRLARVMNIPSKQQQNKQLPSIGESGITKIIQSPVAFQQNPSFFPTQLTRDCAFLSLSVLNHGRIGAPNYASGSMSVCLQRRPGLFIRKKGRGGFAQDARAIHHANTQCAGDNIS
jgi:hypothetical protein